jgi:ribosomal silencing factor RsfS
MAMEDTKLVLFHGFSQEETIKLMRAVKQALADPRETAFAMTTESNQDWTVRDLIEHVGEEHRAMLEREDIAQRGPQH